MSHLLLLYHFQISGQDSLNTRTCKCCVKYKHVCHGIHQTQQIEERIKSVHREQLTRPWSVTAAVIKAPLFSVMQSNILHTPASICSACFYNFTYIQEECGSVLKIIFLSIILNGCSCYLSLPSVPDVTKVTRVIGGHPTMTKVVIEGEPVVTKVTRVIEGDSSVTKVTRVIEGDPSVTKVTRVIEGDPSVTRLTRVIEGEPSITKVTRVIEGKLLIILACLNHSYFAFKR